MPAPSRRYVLRSRGQPSLVGTQIEVLWPLDNAWYLSDVLGYDEGRQAYGQVPD